MLADLWGDCVPGNVDRPSILEKLSGKKFSGEGSLQNWLAFMTRRHDRLKLNTIATQ
jgi:hypothetical protein